jgi:hypothetical protein
MVREREVTMQSLIRKTGPLAAACVLLGAGSARAATLEVNVPFPFVVEGQTLPAGQYRVMDDGGIVQIRGERGTHVALNFMTTPANGHDPAGERPALTFTRHENQYRLSGIWESGDYGLAPTASPQSQATASPSHATPATHATNGVVKSITDDTLVISRSGKHGGEIAFTLNTSTHRDGALDVGAPVSVRYRDVGKAHVATAVAAQHAKPQAAQSPK